MHAVAKRIYNVAPDPVRLTLDDGTEATYDLRSAEFFQEDFQGEATRPDEPGTEYRITTTEDREAVILGRKTADDGGWHLVGEVVAADPA